MKKIWIAAAVIAVIILIPAVAWAVSGLAVCEHRWQEATCDTPQTCAQCGEVRGYALGHDWLDANCTQWETCTRCSLTRGMPFGHDWQEATCEEPETCTRCMEVRGGPLGHDWTSATCTQPEICTRCAEEQEPPLDHSWQEATCTQPETCASCGAVRADALDHSWQEATCTAPKTCGRCALTEGDMLPHSWNDATCQVPQTCAQCGLTQGEVTDHRWRNATCTSPETCVYCGLTRGSALGHIWQEADCIMPRRCSRCTAISGSPLGHDFAPSADGATKLCNTCGRSVTTKYVAITFDDGPSGSITDTLLAGLKDRGAKATFFICGYRIRSYLTYPQKILDGGHEIGLHTDSHVSLTRLSAAGVRKELEGMMGLLPEGYHVKLMRPPGGGHNATVRQVCGEMGLSVILWSVDPRDWATNDVNTIVRKIVSGAKDGSIILMHDLKASSVRAALQAIDQLQAQGYEFVTVSELAAIKGQELLPGTAYSSMG